MDALLTWRPFAERAREWSARPLLLLLLALILGMLVRQAPAAIVGLAALAFLCRTRSAWLALGLGLILGLIRAPAPIPTERTDLGEFRGVVQVVQVPQNTRKGMRMIVRSGSERLLLQVERGTDLSLGDLVRIEGQFKSLPTPTRKYWLNWGVAATLQPTEPPEVLQRGLFFWRWGLDLRHRFVSYTDAMLEDRAANVVDALCFNVDAELSTEFREALANSGTIHIISTSGVHVMIVALALGVLLRPLPVPRWVMLLILTGLLFLYAAAAGFRAPAVRAVLMALLVAWAYLFRRQGDPISAWAFAAVLHLIWIPEVLRDISFQLSFTIVGSLVFFARLPETSPQDYLSSLVQSARFGLAASLVATVASIPIIAFIFGRVSLISIVANLAIGFVLLPIMLAALGAWLISGLTPLGEAIGAGLMRLVVEPLTGYLIMMVRAMGDPSWSAISVPPFGVGWVFAFYVGALVLWCPKPRPDPQALPGRG